MNVCLCVCVWGGGGEECSPETWNAIIMYEWLGIHIISYMTDVRGLQMSDIYLLPDAGGTGYKHMSSE